MSRLRVVQPLPSRQDILDFIARSAGPVGKREIIQEFHVRATDRPALRALIREIETSGAAERSTHRRLTPVGALPEIVVIELTGIDDEGEALASIPGLELTPPPVIRVTSVKGDVSLGVGERAVARLRRLEGGGYAATVTRRIRTDTARVLGVLRFDARGEGRITPTDRKDKTSYRVRATEAAGAQDGELVLAIPLPLPRLGLPHAQIIERLGRLEDPKAISLVAIHRHGIPTAFRAEAVAEAEAARPAPLGQRTDLRTIPLVTIDGADARDFDDAVFAEPDAETPGGWHLVVAIADVAWYVRPGSALDRDAYERGNSVYFPDRVVPMLPEALSNELCSLKPGVDRACMALHLWIDAEGRKHRHELVRGLMRSAARLTYERAQAAMDGQGDAQTNDLMDTVLRPLYGAWAALDRARRVRGTLDLDLPERRITLSVDGAVSGVERRVRLDSHRLIEEFMILANVAAAEILEAARRPCMYRVHDLPDPERLDGLRQFLASIGLPGLKLAKGQVVRPRHFADILGKVAGRPEAPLVNELVLRCQAQAVYAPENLGHFGLALGRYAHFTSPIRRYSDLLVHRALIDTLPGAWPDGLGAVDSASFAEAGVHISSTERRAALAERTANDRYIVAFMRDRIGGEFSGRIAHVARFGLFVTLDDTGADGLVPVARLPADYYHHDEIGHSLLGQRTRRVYRLGDRMTVRLVEADTVSGSLLMEPLDHEPSPASPALPQRPPGKSSPYRPPRPAKSPKRGARGPRKKGG